MSVFDSVRNWFETNPFFEFKGRTVSYFYGTYEGKDKYNITGDLYIDNPASRGYCIMAFSVIIGEDGVCRMKVEAYFSSYCDYDTIFEGIVPSVEFLETLFYDCYLLPKEI